MDLGRAAKHALRDESCGEFEAEDDRTDVVDLHGLHEDARRARRPRDVVDPGSVVREQDDRHRRADRPDVPNQLEAVQAKFMTRAPVFVDPQ